MRIPGIRIGKMHIHEQITKGVGKMNICIGRFGIRIPVTKTIN